ncbi:MAG: glycosyltransferase family 39 protein [Desulfobacterales bacterium]|nr:MAG: glycosyltransferase family 39 protein [Desulfobacterales bacterium]
MNDKIKKPAVNIDPAFVLVMVIGSAACLFRLGAADLDIDESFTALVVDGGFGQIMESVKAASTPPLYFYLLWGWQKIFGAAPVALRLFSVAIGLACLAAIYFTTRSIINRSAARWSAFFMATSPLWLFRARDVRMYSLVALLALMALAALYRAFLRNRLPDWIIVILVFAVGCYTHNVLVFLLPVILMPFVTPALKDRRLPAFLTFCLVWGLWLPWLPVIRHQAGSVALQWIVPFWNALPPLLAIPKSLLVFVPGSLYPIIMRPMPHQARFLIVMAIGILAGALFYALRPLPDGRQRISGKMSLVEVRRLLIMFLFCPLLLMWGYSYIVRPIYLVGRYDIVALPAFCMLAGWGVSRWVERAGRPRHLLRSGIAAALLGILWIATLVPYFDGLTNPGFIRSSTAASFLADKMQPGDALVYLGLRRSSLEYALRRHGITPSQQGSFPAELDQHTAWISLEDMMQRSDTLRREGRMLAESLHEYAMASHRVWIAAAGDNPINRLLLDALNELFNVDGSLSSADLGLYCLNPIDLNPK